MRDHDRLRARHRVSPSGSPGRSPSPDRRRRKSPASRVAAGNDDRVLERLPPGLVLEDGGEHRARVGSERSIHVSTSARHSFSCARSHSLHVLELAVRGLPSGPSGPTSSWPFGLRATIFPSRARAHKAVLRGDPAGRRWRRCLPLAASSRPPSSSGGRGGRGGRSGQGRSNRRPRLLDVPLPVFSRTSLSRSARALASVGRTSSGSAVRPDLSEANGRGLALHVDLPEFR